MGMATDCYDQLVMLYNATATATASATATSNATASALLLRVVPLYSKPDFILFFAAVPATSFTNSRTVFAAKERSRCCSEGTAQPGDHVGGGRAYSFWGAASNRGRSHLQLGCH